ncbi:general substrate transporter [Neocallimastix lanati (nom. inval.)]|jgi:sugar porter (SP) family MFS transporter|uniref:General substrate transporter n=1 Tax=Neocallimastix californiae TaxID=1754190 RepID=A0A1Y2C953_9FUNG|nr:general substrate transporter [Neocallimastix sp. JGI-2020a]ORY43558.1 general substrate transporter [Neocallimastix californiae]|eukprot:ORY43558.1 general substrate transporter [Neocallimastix californiae]
MNKYQIIVALTASCGGLLLGYELGTMNVVLVMDGFRIFFNLCTWDGSKLNANGKNIDNDDVTDKVPVYRNLIETKNKSFIEGFITSSFLLGALCGALLASYFGEKFGRQRTIMLGACIFSFGGILQGCSVRSYIMISFGRLITGISVGCNSVLCPTYISEVASAKIRGTLSSCFQLMITFGTVTAAIINATIWYFTNFKPKDLNSYRNDSGEVVNNFEWRISLGLQAIPGICLAIFLYFLPKSPRWLCSKDRSDEALKVLAKLNDTDEYNPKILEILREIENDVNFKNATGTSSIKELFGSGIRRRTFTTIILQLLQQWTGINVIMYYQSQIYSYLGFSKFTSTIIFPIVNNFVNFISILPTMWYIDKFGRKILLYVGALLMIIFHILTWVFSIQISNGKIWGYLTVASIILFIFSFGATWGPVPWVYQSEVFPLRTRIKGSAVGTISNFFNNWIITFVGPLLMEALGERTFILFSVNCLIAFYFAYFFCIESKGLDIEEMDRIMSKV